MMDERGGVIGRYSINADGFVQWLVEKGNSIETETKLAADSLKPRGQVRINRR
jgi:hypothetical protein